ncbi:MAG: S1C family serine protease [Planctomycetota bacterium]|jgi:S1-C subfamily serine protease
MAASPRDRSIRLLRRSVVKVMTVADPPDYEQPWQTAGPTHAIGSGAVIKTPAGLRVLTNAHVVEHHTFIEVRRYGDATKYVAEVEGIGPECDLALLRVDAPAFYRGTRAIPVCDMPGLSDRVSVLGFPIGGDRLSITEGVVSRIEMTAYAQSERSLLTMQIDAAINAGNSGGPVIKDGGLVGVAFQALEEAENIGYVIPSPIVGHFLHDLEDGAIDGFPDLGIATQDLDAEVHRRALGLAADEEGVLVTHVDFEGSAWKVVEVGDVLLSIDGESVAADGSVAFGKGARIEFSHVPSLRQVGDTMTLGLLRGDERLDLEVSLRTPRLLVPGGNAVARPSYFLYAGLLFVPLTRGFLETWGDDWRHRAPYPLLTQYEEGVRTPSCRQIVILQQVLADPVNRGYHEYGHLRIVKVQGKRIRDLNALVRIVDRSKGAYVRFETDHRAEIVIDRRAAGERKKAILQKYGVPGDRSPDLAPRKRRARRKRKAPRKRTEGR